MTAEGARCEFYIANLSRLTLHLERVTVLRSNLRDLVTPDLILQLNALKNHISIKSFTHP